MAKYVLTCEIDGCVNNGVPIELETESTNISCGPCGEEISNKVEVDA
jgi:predicted RNA-binding Zn-ribbon protein involved in translation (DUF1610 family)